MTTVKVALCLLLSGTPCRLSRLWVARLALSLPISVSISKLNLSPSPSPSLVACYLSDTYPDELSGFSLQSSGKSSELESVVGEDFLPRCSGD